jgi:glycolate oxidase
MDSSTCELFSECGCTLIERLLPKVVLVPEDVEAITRLVKIAAEKRLRVFPTGAGTSFSAEYTPPTDTVFLLMNQMSQVRELRLGDAIIGTEVGIMASDLAGKLEETELELPASVLTYAGTIGGAILGPDPEGSRHMELRRRLLGVEVVDPKGEIQKFGSHAIKNVAGYDLWSFLVGTNGRFGVLTQVILNVEKMPPFTVQTTTEDSCGERVEANEWIYANLCKVLDPDGIFVR